MATSARTTHPDHLATRDLQFHQVEDLLRLQKAAQKITSILDLDQLIDKVVHEIATSFGCLEANIYLHDEPRAELILAGVCGCTTHEKGQILKVGKDGMVGHVAATGKMRCARSSRHSAGASAKEFALCSGICYLWTEHSRGRRWRRLV